MFILDTNVLSEAVKPAPSKAVLSWLAEQEPLRIFTTAITHAEILYGIAILPNGKRKNSLQTAVETMFATEFPGRVLPFDDSCTHLYSQIVANRESLGRPISQFDAIIASIARTHHAVLVTRNTRDFEDCGIQTINPFATLTL